MDTAGLDRHFRSPSRVLPLLALAAMTVVGCQQGAADRVVVLHTANAYGTFDDCGCRYDSTGGLAKRAWTIDSLERSLDAPVLVVDAGDFSGGDNAYGAALGRVMVDAMEIMGYDAFTLGEWDMNQGTAYLREIVAGDGVPWVHTNYEVEGLEGAGHRTLILERAGRRIGILGLFNPTILLDPRMRDSVRVEPDPVASARRGVTELRAAGVDAVIVLSHLSYPADRALVGAVEGIDLVVSGHGGKSLVSPVKAAPSSWIVAPGDLGRFLGRAEIAFDGPGPEVEDVTGELLVMGPSIPDDPRLEPLFARYEEQRRALMEQEFDARRSAEGARLSEEPSDGGSAPLGRPEN